MKALKNWEVKRKYIYGIKDLENTINGITYEILIDPNNSGKKKIAYSERKTVDPKKAKYQCSVKFKNGNYAIKRNVATKLKAKSILDKLKSKIDKCKTDIAIRELLIKESRKS